MGVLDLGERPAGRLGLCPPEVRVCLWRRQIRHTRSRRPLSAWEPLIVFGGRELPTNVTQAATDALASRPVDDPERTFVIYMGVYAADVLRGELPSPYSDAQARRYARVALIPGELLEHDLPCLEDTARALHVPISELRQARAESVSRESPGEKPI